MQRNEVKIGVIGGSGLDVLEGMTEIEETCAETPFGTPSDGIVTGRLSGINIAFLPRHGRGYYLLPGEIPARANIYALKCLGVEKIIAVNSCGRLKDTLQPGEFLIPDQVIDRTQGRAGSFSGEGVVFHISLAEPFCPGLSRTLYESAKTACAEVHQGGTYVVVEGPASATRAESRLYKHWGADVIGMTVLPEAKLAREAGICYASIGLIKDFDSWQEQESGVAAGNINDFLQKQLETVEKIIRQTIPRATENRCCSCPESLSTAMVTATERMTLEQKKRLDSLIVKG
jgi:5'-methylthioadenosine phosphorylase